MQPLPLRPLSKKLKAAAAQDAWKCEWQHGNGRGHTSDWVLLVEPKRVMSSWSEWREAGSSAKQKTFTGLMRGVKLVNSGRQGSGTAHPRAAFETGFSQAAHDEYCDALRNPVGDIQGLGADEGPFEGGQLKCQEYANMNAEMGTLLNCARDFSIRNPTGNYHNKVVVQ